MDKIWHNQRTDGSEYWALSINGERYTIWEKDLIADIKEGDLVEFAFTFSGRYRNLTGIRRLASSAFTTADKLVSDPTSLRITRMNCLRTAAEMLKDTTLLPEQKVSLAITMAQQLENHVLGNPENSELQEVMRQKEDDWPDLQDQQEGGA